MKKGVIFDVDGVIINVRESYHYAIKYTAERFLGREVPIDDVRRIKFSRGINNDWLATLEVIREYGGKASLEEVIQTFNPIYHSLRDKESLLLSREFFINLRSGGLPLGVVTGRPEEDLRHAFERFGLLGFFDCIVNEDTIPQKELRKPNPYALHFCVEAMGLEGGVYVGDSLADWSMVRDYRMVYHKPMEYLHLGETLDVDGVRYSSPERLLQDLQEVLQNL